jgi:hypothetical protein
MRGPRPLRAVRVASAARARARGSARAGCARRTDTTSLPPRNGQRAAVAAVTTDSTLREWAARGARAPDTLLARTPVRCAGQPISDVVVITQPPYANGLLGRFQFVARVVRELHSTTRTELVRRFMILNPGEPCDELRRAESERILRAQPYLVDARVVAYDDGEGGVRLEVETRDEFSGIIALAGGSGRPGAPGAPSARRTWPAPGGARHGRLVRRRRRLPRRDRRAAHALPVPGDARTSSTCAGCGATVGGNWTLDVSHPFYTDLQRIAWRASTGAPTSSWRRAAAAPRATRCSSTAASPDVGGILRVGVPGRPEPLRRLVSTRTRGPARPGRGAQRLGPRERRGPGAPATAERALQRPALGARERLWGVRSVRFLRVTGFEALTGAQDVRRGFQLGTMVGRSLGLLGSHDDDVFVSGDLYIGAGSERSFGALELRGEGRQDNDRNEWNAMVGSGRGAWYMVPDDRQRVIVDVQYSGAWRPRIPVQFALGARDGGARGFRDTELAGAGRVVARLEHRMVFGRPFNLGDIGMAAFSDVGRIWAGDAPYGVTTPVRASLGVGLLAAVPPRSRRLWRVDLAYPLTKEAGSGLQLSFSNRDMTRQFWREPRDVQLSRTRAVPSSVFTWP